MTGENEQGLRSVIDLTRLLSIAVLLIHFYIICYPAFSSWELTASITDRLVENIRRLPFFQSVMLAKSSALVLLVVFLLGVKGKKDGKVNLKAALAYCGCGLALYFLANLFLFVPGGANGAAVGYMTTTLAGYLMMVSGGTYLSRLLKTQLRKDIFNKENETFPQEERLLENEYSLNFPARYRYGGRLRNSWINVAPFRSCLVLGSPGAGKSYYVVRSVIEQQIRKGFSMFLYDFKYDDLSRIAYNYLLKYQGNYKVPPKFYVINFDTPMHRCNPLEPEAMRDITDATEASRTILLGLNRDWIKKQGEFFVESPINLLTAVIWFLKKYQDGKYCTLPHAIELMQADYRDLFPILSTEEDIEALINPFISAFKNRAMEQLEGQVASAKIALARLSSPSIYYVLTGNDFSLNINDPVAPKIVCAANNPEKVMTYGAVLSLYVFRLIRVILKKGQNKCSIIIDELPSIFLNGLDNFIAVCRSYLISNILCVQTYQQLVKDYGKEQADVLMNLCGNIIAGQSFGATAKELSERFGKIVQQRDSISINRQDTSVSKSTQLDSAIPPSTIATLSPGEFVGIVADNPDQPIEQKIFHAEIQNDHHALKAESEKFVDIPNPNKVTEEEIADHFIIVKNDITKLVKELIADIEADPVKSRLLLEDKTRDPGPAAGSKRKG